MLHPDQEGWQTPFISSYVPFLAASDDVLMMLLILLCSPVVQKHYFSGLTEILEARWGKPTKPFPLRVDWVSCRLVSAENWISTLPASSPEGEVCTQVEYCSSGWLLSSVGLVPHGMYIQEPFSLAYLWDLFLTGTGDHWFLNETSWDCEKEKFFDMMVWSWIMDHVGYGSLHNPTKQLGGLSSNSRHQFKRRRHKLLDIQEK